MSDTNVDPKVTPPVETKAPEAEVKAPDTTESKTPESIINQPEVKADETAPGKEKDPAEKKEPEKAPPAEIDLAKFTLPEGYKADEKQLKDFTDILVNPEIKNPQERAQALIDLHAKVLKDASEAASSQWTEVTAKWTKEVAADKEIGSGDPKSPLKPEVKSAISKVIDQFGGTELRQALDLTGAGNNPVLIRAFSKIAKQLTEGGHIAGNGPSVAKPKGTGAAALYPDNPE